MPVLIRGSSNMIVMPSTYSPATIAREFKVIHEFELSSMKYGVIWQGSALFQVEGMVVEQGARGKGLATLLYEELVVKCGVILMSDNKQYEAGKALWQKIAQESDKLAVFILDSDVGQFYPYCGDRVPYNGKGIPEEKIWSLHPDTTKWGVVLVAENREKISQYC